MAQLTITESDLGPLVLTISLLLLSWITVAIIGRGVTKLWILRKLAADDILMIACLIAATVQTVTIAAAAVNGLGKHQYTLSSRQLTITQKTVYVSDIVFVLSLLCAKLAMLTTLYALSPAALHKNLVLATATASLIWALTSAFVFAFRCPAARAWDWTNPSCHDSISIGLYVAIFNFLTEITLVCIPAVIIKDLQLSNKRKATVLALFASRVIWIGLTDDSVIAPILCQIVYLLAIGSPNDFSFELWKPIICTQFVQFTCISATCIVFLKPYLECLESGFIRVDDTRRKEMSGYVRNSLYEGTPRRKPAGWTGKQHSNKSSGKVDMQDSIELLKVANTAATAEATAVRSEVPEQFVAGGITETRSWTVSRTS